MRKTILTIVFLLVIFTGYFFFDSLQRAFARPLLYVSSKLDHLISFSDYFAEKEKLFKENKELKRKLEELKFEKILNLSLKQDLKEIKSLDDSAKELDLDDYKILRLKPSLPPRVRYLTLQERPDKFAYFIFAQNKFLLASLKSGESKDARLFSATGRFVPAYILQDGEKVKVTLRGKSAGAFLFELNKDYKIKKGDTVFYKSFPVAVVYKVEDNEQSPYFTVYAGVPVNLNNLDFVLAKKHE